MITCTLKLPIDPAMDILFSYIIRRENRIFFDFFFKSKIWNDSILVIFGGQIKYIIFLSILRISRRKINILKKFKMELTKLIKLYNIIKKQLLLNLINILKSATKNVKKKKKKKSAQNFFILKYVTKSFKPSNFYYLKVLV